MPLKILMEKAGFLKGEMSNLLMSYDDELESWL